MDLAAKTAAAKTSIALLTTPETGVVACYDKAAALQGDIQQLKTQIESHPTVDPVEQQKLAQLEELARDYETFGDNGLRAVDQLSTMVFAQPPPAPATSTTP